MNIRVGYWVVLTVFFAFGGAAVQADVVLDDFESGPFGPLVDTTANGMGVRATQSGLPTSSVFSGTRTSQAQIFSGAGSATAQLDLSGSGDHGATINVTSGATGNGFFLYDGLGAHDFTAGGETGFEFTLTVDPGFGHVSVGFAHPTGFANQNIFLNGSGTYRIPFADYSTAPEAVSFLSISVNKTTGGTFDATLSDFRTTPEPATLSLLALGALSVLRRSRRH